MWVFNYSSVGSLPVFQVKDSTLWIHKPVCLPVVFEHAYHRERALSNTAREAKGHPGFGCTSKTFLVFPLFGLWLRDVETVSFSLFPLLV